MSRSFSDVLCDSLRLTLEYAELLLKDVPTDRFARLACPGGQMVTSNHPAFLCGHLSLYGPKVMGFAGADELEVPDQFEELFSQHSKCVDDADGTVYPDMSTITEFFFSGYNGALEAILASDAAVWGRPNPSQGRMAETFPTVGSLANFLVGGHVMLHLGQMSAWRRMQGLGPA